VEKAHRREEEPYFFGLDFKRKKIERSLSQFDADVGIGTYFENRMMRCYSWDMLDRRNSISTDQ
jgi:hypothetical protein